MEFGVFEDPGREWDEFASRYTDLIFYQSLWGEVLRRGMRAKPLYFYLKDQGEIVGGLPSVVFHFGPFKLLYSTISYGHYIGSPQHRWVFFSELDKELSKRGVDRVSILDSPFSPQGPPPTYDPFASTESVCTRLNVTQWKGLSGNRKRDVNLARRSGVSVRDAVSADAELVYRLYRESMKRNRAGVKYPLRWFRVVGDILVRDEGLADFLIAEKGGEAIAMICLIYSPSCVHYFHAGSRTEYLKLCPNDLLLGTALEEAATDGMSWFDFMASSPDDRSLIQFKEKWGASSATVSTYVKDYSPHKMRVWERGKEIALRVASA